MCPLTHRDFFMTRVLLLIDCISEFDRRLLRGLVRFAKEEGDWLFYRMPPSSFGPHSPDGAKTVADWARKWKADAIAGRWVFPDTKVLSHLGIPVVLQNISSRSKQFSNLTGDYYGTGEIAADFFFRRRFRNYAYFGIKDLVWSEERRNGFCSRVEKLGGNYDELIVDVRNERNEKMLTSWLQGLPKPAAVFACDDSHALIISEACKMAGIPIPADVALLGVDDDELICEVSDPPISSISLDVEQGGYDLGVKLRELLLDKNRKPFNITIKPGVIVQRASTQRHNIKDPYISQLVKYIDDHFNQEISTSDILDQIPLSRRSIELKFKREMGGVTIYKYLTSCRIEHFAQLLSTTDLPLGEIAAMAGISDYSNFSRIFKKQKGVSPLDFRKRIRQQDP